VEAHLYAIKLSHPSHAARLMLEHKGIEHRVTMFPAGLHPALVRLVGFRGNTVPVMKIDGRRVEKSLVIARELDRLKPDPGLYPADAAARARVEEAERWGEAELQPVPRRMFRWALTQQRAAREWTARFEGLPVPSVQARINVPLVNRQDRRATELPEATWHEIIDLVLNGTFYCCKYVGQQMLRVGEQTGAGLTAVQHGCVVTAGQRGLDHGAAHEAGAADEEDSHGARLR